VRPNGYHNVILHTAIRHSLNIPRCRHLSSPLGPAKRPATIIETRAPLLGAHLTRILNITFVVAAPVDYILRSLTPMVALEPRCQQELTPAFNSPLRTIPNAPGDKTCLLAAKQLCCLYAGTHSIQCVIFPSPLRFDGSAAIRNQHDFRTNSHYFFLTRLYTGDTYS